MIDRDESTKRILSEWLAEAQKFCRHGQFLSFVEATKRTCDEMMMEGDMGLSQSLREGVQLEMGITMARSIIVRSMPCALTTDRKSLSAKGRETVENELLAHWSHYGAFRDMVARLSGTLLEAMPRYEIYPGPAKRKVRGKITAIRRERGLMRVQRQNCER